MKYYMECTYCGKKWSETYTVYFDPHSISCSVCGDKRIKIKEHSKATFDSYKGCPPFPEKTIHSISDKKEEVDSNKQDLWEFY